MKCFKKETPKGFCFALFMQIPYQLVSEKDIQSGGDSLADENSQKEFSQVDSERSGDIANQIGGQKRKKAPKYDDRQLIFRKGCFQSEDLFWISFFKK